LPTGRRVVRVSPVRIVSMLPYQSDQPSPICSGVVLVLRQPTFDGPPTSRLEMPWPYSWTTTCASSEPSTAGVTLVPSYICIRGRLPSGGVAKLALLWQGLVSLQISAPLWTSE